ncbi:MAG: DUF885 domain-containing protein [Pseudomonadota bacterium]
MKRSVCLLLLAVVGCTQEAPAPPVADSTAAPDEVPPPTIEQIADRYFEASAEQNPTFATSAGLPGYRHDRLPDRSPASIDAFVSIQRELLADLRAVGEPEDIGSRDWVTWGILVEALSNNLAVRVCRSELWSASTTTGWYTSLPFVFDYQPLGSEEDRADALARLAALPAFIDTDISNLRSGLELGYSAPRVTVQKVPAEASALLQDNNPFLAMGERAGDNAFAEEVGRIYTADVVPAIERYVAFIRDEYLPAARETLAVTGNPNGAACYDALIRYFATVGPSADDVHQQGLTQMARIQQEFREVIDAHYDGEATPRLLRRINTDPEFTFNSEEAVLKYSVDALDAAKAAMPRAFGRLPKADVIIRPYPEFAASGVGAYQIAAEDGSRPGIFWIAVVDPQTRTRATQKSTLYHETYPGHHLQGVIAQELGDRAHRVARYSYNSGFGEGWALYAERVADELGLYSTPVDRLGLLSDQGARAARLVVDTGLHTKGWTRQQAVDYMLANTGWAETDIQNDVNRYISWPGQANSYMLGMLEIQRLRRIAENAFGDDFELRDFHDRVLENGSVTLPMLERAILSWIARSQAEKEAAESGPEAFPETG